MIKLFSKPVIFFTAFLICASTVFTNKSQSEINNGGIKNDTIKNPDGSYVENVHMYICIQALRLLQDKFPQYDLTAFSNRIGNMTDFGDRPWQTGRITTGAYREDKEDVVFDIRGPFGFFASNSHFFNADDRTNGDHTLTNLNILGSNYQYPNAFTKIKRFEDGKWYGWYGNGYGGRRYINYNSGNGNFYQLSYHRTGLIDFYKTKRIWHEQTINTSGKTFQIRQEVIVADYIRDLIAWEVLGRMAHLIQDMTVPAHVKNDVHVRFWDGGDCYHNYIDDGAYNNYNWITAKQSGGFINPYENNDDPLRYIMYTCSQLADHYTSGPDCFEIPQQHSGNNNLQGGTNPMINDYYMRLGPPPLYIENLEEQASYCFNHAIRATCALFYWFGVETGLITTDPMALPSITGFSKNLPDNYLHRGETLVATCNALGSNLRYDWFISVCDSSNNCTEPVPGLNITQEGNKLIIRNTNFKNRYTCSFYDTLCSNNSRYLSEGPLKFLIGVNVYNQFGRTKKYFNFNTHNYFSPLEILRPPDPPVSGCPWVLNSDGLKFNYENNILKNSLHSRNVDNDITDVFFLENEPYINFSERITEIAVKEVNNDNNFFDKISLSFIEHPEGSKAGVTETNDIFIYYPDEVISPSYAELSGKDVSNEAAYDTLYNYKATGKKDDFLFLEFPPADKKVNSNGITADSIAVIFDPNSPTDNNGNPVVKNVTGLVTATGTDGGIKSEPVEFGMRQLRSDVFIPLFKNCGIKTVSVNWNRDFEFSYFGAVPLYFRGFNEKHLNLDKAEDYKTGDVTDLLRNKDLNYISSDSSSFLILKFKTDITEPAPGYKRTYFLRITGRTLKDESNRNFENTVNLINNESNSVFKNKLYGNYPNPFNPSTEISYELQSSGLVTLKIYDLLGREIKTLVNEIQNAGNHSISFKPERLSGGIYFYVLNSGNFFQTGKMILLK